MRLMVMLTMGVALVMAGCGTRAMPQYEADAILNSARGSATAIVAQAYTEAFASPTNTATLTPTATATATVTDTPRPSQTPSPAASATPQLTDTPEPSGSVDVPADAAERAAAADPQHGQELFNRFQPAASFGCFTCHHVDSDERLIGPGLLNIASRSAGRVEGLNAAQYIYQSIVNPSAYVVEGYPDQLMPQNWSEIYSDEEIYDIIAYLLTLED